MKILYFDCPTGVSGDMFLASLIDMGVDFKSILRELKKLSVDRIDVSLGRETRHSITGTTFRVKITEAHHHRTFRDIKALIAKSRLSSGVKALSTEIFRTIAVAEGKVHGISPEKVHFHEVGAMDSIIDIVGAAVAVESLKPGRVVCSPIPLGSGWADTMHGRIPVPAPATVEILKGVPLAQSGIPFELTTPTGAAIMKTIATAFGGMPAMTVEKTGYGAGKKDFRESANLLRVMMGRSYEKSSGEKSSGEKAPGPRDGEQELTVLETNIDDMSPQIAGYLLERLLDAGALDAFLTPVQMKKSRPGILLTVLCEAEKSEPLLDLIFAESTTIGVRTYPVQRRCLERKTEKVKTPYGAVRIKVSMKDGRAVNIQPEYEDCKEAALRKKAPLKMVMDAARAAFENKG
ncbi:MAG: nickel pincer cofactor biosynthesis protein LarC [Deltaproteobacteria bacterium]|nr:nickel pincer cofactor biosynthesis protein LarC [Deltaproteobacteria bacterium]